MRFERIQRGNLSLHYMPCKMSSWGILPSFPKMHESNIGDKERERVSCIFFPRLKAPPETLDQLGGSLLLLDQLQGEMEATENEFEPLQYVRKLTDIRIYNPHFS